MTNSTVRAYVSSFRSLLEVEWDGKPGGTLRKRVIEQGRGIYFGLTRCDGRVLVVARNLDSRGRKVSAAEACNLICSLDPESGTLVPVLASPDLRDLHQIRAVGDWLCIIQGHGSRIAVFDRHSWRQTGEIALEPFIPDELRHTDHGNDGVDCYHFNSLTFTGSRLLVLAHNWQRGSFALELGYTLADDGPRLTGGAVLHADLGEAAHDVVVDRGTLHALDSQNGALLLRGECECQLELQAGPSGAALFPRGLALSRDHILLATGTWLAERNSRLVSETRLMAVDRGSRALVLDASLGQHGNSCDVLLMSPSDLSDDPGRAPPRGREMPPHRAPAWPSRLHATPSPGRPLLGL